MDVVVVVVGDMIVFLGGSLDGLCPPARTTAIISQAQRILREVINLMSCFINDESH